MKKHIIILLVLILILSEICLLSLSHIDVLNNYGKLMIVFMIVPIARIIEVFITFEFFWKVLIFYSILLFLSFYYSVRFKLDHGHKKEKLGFLPFAVAVGIGLGIMSQSLFMFNKYSWLIYFIPFIAYSEEILFRGMIQNILGKNLTASVAVLITALLYGVFSSGYGILFASFMFLTGIVIGIVYSSTKNIFLAVVINFLVHYYLFVML